MKEKINISEIFGENVFNDRVMRARLPKAVYKELRRTIETGSDLNSEIADVVANEMKEWAIEKGATHYTHWFQPMTGITAEKHDAFISPSGDGKVLMEFSGKELIKGESDASSFPSGGLRAIFEARGYTTWDCTSPAFIKETDNAKILCIPTAFCSYTGEALDKKTPLLRSMQALDIQARRCLALFGKTDIKKVTASVGAEQEYFLIDKKKYLQRKDIVYAGRTLFGSMPAKGQELDDHYYGSIKERIADFMSEVNEQLWKLGIMAKTQHNEVAPAQHELAPIYEEGNIATDHNQLIMETMKRVADTKGLHCMLHEKPFAGINGSGKHNNWSIVTNEGQNLLDPGTTPHDNQQFLFFLSAIIKAVDLHGDLLRVSTATPGNDHRLGASEAPPAIISIYLGEQLEDVIRQLDTTGEATTSKQGDLLMTGVNTLPDFLKDATDRNRTSPFAFTGNKFEFRMLGSSQSTADPNIVLNTIVADVLADAADEIEKADNKLAAIHDYIRRTVSEHKRIIFNGNGYTDEWVAEAERRGLPHLKSMVDSVSALTTEKSIKLFERHKVYTKAELEARHEILFEEYVKKINIEARAMLNIVRKQIIPAVMKYQECLANSIIAMRNAIGEEATVQSELLRSINENLKELYTAVGQLEEECKQGSAMSENIEEQAKYYHEVIFKSMGDVRRPADRLEMLVDKSYWPFPSYGDLLFEV